MIRAVLDTNAWISGILTPHGTPGKILSLWRERRFDVVISPEIIEELGRVLLYPKIQKRSLLSPSETKQFLSSLTQICLLVPGKLNFRVVKQDPSDDKFFIAAVEGGAGYVVSGDTQVLKVKRFQGIRVIKPEAFLRRLRKR